MSIETEAADWFARMHGPDASGARDAFAAWYADAPHAAAYDQLVRTWDQTKFLANTPIGRARNLETARPYGVGRAAIMAGTSLLVAAALAIMIVGPFGHRAKTADGPVAATEAMTGSAGRRTLALPDGSHVLLDRSSRLRLVFSGAERRLRLIAGRARFDVAHDPGRPFVVEAGGGSVTAHGTMFDVSLAPNGMAVVLLRGAVDVRDDRAGSTPSHVRTLVPGQKVLLFDGMLGAPVTATPADAQWLPAMLDFDAIPLGEAVAAFNRSGGRAVHLAPGAGDGLRVTGSFRRDDPDAFAATLAATFDLDVRRDGDASLTLMPRMRDRPAKKP